MMLSQTMAFTPENVLNYLKDLPTNEYQQMAEAWGKMTTEEDFFPSLSRMAFTQAVFQSNVFLPRLNAMRIPVSFHTALKTAELLAFLDSGVRLKLAFCMTCAVRVLVLAQGPSF